MSWIVWSKQQKKLEHHRLILFDRNGGNVLKKKLSKRKRSALKIYTAEEMRFATKDYSYSRSVLQRCNNQAKFYRGILENREVVVMKIPAPLPESKVEQFVDDLIFLSLPHRNVVRVLGCCLETSLPLVIYERHGDGNCTLSDCLRCAIILPEFSGAKAAAEAAVGLAYLRSRFVHGNFCGGNVLLDDSFDAKLFYAAASGLRFVDGSSDLENNDVDRLAVVLGEVIKCGRALDNDDEVMMRAVCAMAERCLSLRLEERPTFTQLQANLTAWINVLNS